MNADLVSLVNRFDLALQRQQYETNVVRCSAAAIGDYKFSARTGDSRGWVACDGRSLEKAIYVHLFAIIGSSFGGDATTFKLPDFRGRVPGAIGSGIGLTPRPLGSVVGAETHTLSVAEIPGHVHTGSTSVAGSHGHTTNATGGSQGLAVADGANTCVQTDASPGEINVWTTPTALVVNAAGDHGHSLVTDSTGGDIAHPNMQPTLFAGNVFIFAGIVSSAVSA